LEHRDPAPPTSPVTRAQNLIGGASTLTTLSFADDRILEWKQLVILGNLGAMEPATPRRCRRDANLATEVNDKAAAPGNRAPHVSAGREPAEYSTQKQITSGRLRRGRNDRTRKDTIEIKVIGRWGGVEAAGGASMIAQRCGAQRRWWRRADY
jgi:hypothetical protein